MENLHSSPARLADLGTIALFKKVMLRHGVLGYGSKHELVFEHDRFRIVPLIFGLLPKQAVQRQYAGELIKPYIREHLNGCGAPNDEELVSIIKRISDQFFETRSVADFLRKRKYGISDVKARNLALYTKLLRSQNGRCAICGLLFDRDAIEELDHMVPWRLIGDVPDGSNWQILCGDCNKGKGEWVSALQSAEYLNWSYRGGESLAERPTLEARYVVLALRPRCEVGNCALDSKQTQLHVVKKAITGLAVTDHLTVRCSEHLLV